MPTLSDVAMFRLPALFRPYIICDTEPRWKM